MTQKAVNMTMAILGLAAVATLFVVGANLRRATVTGPRWRRRLVTAGLALLGFLAGSTTPASAESQPPAAATREKDEADLANSADWKIVEETWSATKPLADSGQSTEAQRKQADRKLAAATNALTRLAKAGLLAPQEVALLSAEADHIKSGIYANPPTDSMVSCYEMVYLPPAKLSFDRLSARLPLVESLVKAGKVHPAAGTRIVAAMEADVKVLSDSKLIGEIPEPERKNAEAMREKVSAAIENLKSQFPSALSAIGSGAPANDELPATREWKRLTVAWKDAEEVASGKRGDYPFNERGQKKMLDSLAKSTEDVNALLKKGLLSESESGLLKVDLARLARGVQSKRPSERKQATCYKPMMFRPGEESMERLSERLPLLDKLAYSRKLHPDVVARLLVQIEADLATLEKQEITNMLSPESRKKAEELRKSVAAQVDKLKAAVTRAE